MTTRTIIWRRKDHPGHESAQLIEEPREKTLRGSTVFLYEEQPCRMDYTIKCDADWLTQSAVIDGWLDNQTVHVEISTDDKLQWWLNGELAPGLDGCLDIDLNFSPVTNLLPIRRLGLRENQQARVRAAWLRFPSLALEPLEQTYKRVGPSTYRYQSKNFTADIQVDNSGLVLYYSDIWVAEAISR
jgi:hypothetical protein